jgi:hypothetical protein
MDLIINESPAVFRTIAREFGDQTITDSHAIRKFFELLFERTNGLVILDFLDMGNWDIVEKFSFDNESRILTLVWHDFNDVEEEPDVKEDRQMLFPASLYSLAININTIVPICGEKSAIFLINGFAKTEKEIKQLYRDGASEFNLSDNSFFEKRIVRKVNKEWEIIDFHCTPIYSIAIIPKRAGISSGDSKNLLYLHNVDESIKRITRVIDALDNVAANNYDEICEKLNTARRVLESVLKIECCFREVEVKSNYSQLLLGQLFSLLKEFKMPEEQLFLNRTTELLNEFSHDSGKPVELYKAKLSATLVLAYIKTFQIDINSKVKHF